MRNRSDVQCRYHFLQLQKAGIIQKDPGASGESWCRVLSPMQASLIRRRRTDQNTTRQRAQKKPDDEPVVVNAADEVPWVKEVQRPEDCAWFAWSASQEPFMEGVEGEPIQWF
jgi:hypothetical protein